MITKRDFLRGLAFCIIKNENRQKVYDRRKAKLVKGSRKWKKEH